MVVEYYELPDGTFPAEEFILGQNVKMRARIFRNLELLELEGMRLREPYSKSLGDGIYEVRTRVGSDATRILYFFFSGNRAILTNGFVKKTQKTPTGELVRAKKYRAEYLKRSGE